MSKEMNSKHCVAEPVERRVRTTRNSEPPPVTITQSVGQTESGLVRIRRKAKTEPKLQFNNLLHHITVTLLWEAYDALNKKAAEGVDNESWEDYGEQLLERLTDLHKRLHTDRYRPKPSKRIWIIKDNGQKRPIGIATVEDKIVQQALVFVLESIYEEAFLGFSYGFRPGRSQHHALDAVSVAITEKKVSWVLDADISGFFDHINHEWLMKFLGHRVSDQRILKLIRRILKAGVSEDGKKSKSVVGTPQGAVISPLLANIYLHYVLDLWVNSWRKNQARGDVYIVRYADDSVLGFQYQSDGFRLRKELQQRLEKFGLALNLDKTKLIEFGRFAASNRQKRKQGKPETFEFLGFTHICSEWQKGGGFIVRRITISKRLGKKLQEIKKELMYRIVVNVHDQGKWLRQVVQGYFNYFGVPGNSRALNAFRTQICRMWLRTLRRRSQRGRNMNWFKIQRLIKRYIPNVTVRHPFPNERFVRPTCRRSRMR